MKSIWTLLILIIAVSTTAIAQVPHLRIGVYSQEVSASYGLQEGLPALEVSSVTVTQDGRVYAGTAQGVFLLQGDRWTPVEKAPDDSVDLLAADEDLHALLGKAKSVQTIAVRSDETVAAGAENGLFLKSANREWAVLYPNDEHGRSWALRNVRGVGFDSLGRLWFASPQGVGCFDGEDWTLYTGAEGLPYNHFTCMAIGQDDVIWLGTTMGVIRFDGNEWEYRQGPRWLPHDHVNDIALTPDGDAWIATSGGVGRIYFEPMTLAEKAEFYENEVEKYIKRTEFGYLSEVSVRQPGDKSEIVYHDSDNDGLWTSMYGAGECFAYAATKDPKAKERARQAFEALAFLSEVTQGGEVEMQPGYVARTIVPTDQPNPNERGGYTLEGQRRRQQTEDARWKVYFPRWPLSQDEKYWFKTDTSSDELDGHFFFYALYHDLVAETAEEKERVKTIVRGIVDHLIRNDYVLMDHDGTPTRWAVYNPTSLNRDFDWHFERGLNSLSMLSYLTVAEHLTGDSKYSDAVRELRDEHYYDMNAMFPKVHNGIGSGNQSDDEMAFMCFYNLIHYTKDERLKNYMIFSFYTYWIREFPEMNPFFNFAYAASAIGERYKDSWGEYSLNPWEGWLEDSVETLKGFPLDRFNWPHQNSHRLDIVPLEPQAAIDYTSGDRRKRGHRVNGKVLSVENRHFNHWNTDPWTLDYNGNGNVLASGTVYLLPYYMGLYHGFIE